MVHSVRVDFDGESHLFNEDQKLLQVPMYRHFATSQRNTLYKTLEVLKRGNDFLDPNQRHRIRRFDQVCRLAITAAPVTPGHEYNRPRLAERIVNSRSFDKALYWQFPNLGS